MATINKHPNRFELTAVYRHLQAKADIVLVHGLNGNPEKTWTAPNGVYWPADLLPASLKDQHANILVYGYNADVFGGFWERTAKSPSDNFIHHHAQTLVATLAHYRKSEGTERNPIIWVVHSLGGIVTKRAILYSSDLRDPNLEDLRSVYVSTYGIIFLGTPHTGAGAAAWGGVIQRMADALVPRKLFETESVLLKSLKKDNETLQQINNHFLDVYRDFKIHMAHENQKTDIKGSKILVVDALSASPQLAGVTYYGIEATHSGMCKFASEDAPGYRTVSTAIHDWVSDAPDVIPFRWGVEDERRRVRANLDNFERNRLYQRPALGSGAHTQTVVPQSDNEIASTQPRPSLLEAQAQSSEPRSISVPLLLTSTPDPYWPPSPQLLPHAHPDDVPHPRDELQQQRQPPPPPPPNQEPLFIHPETFRPNSYFVGREDELRGLHEMLMDRKRRADGTSAVLIRSLPGGGKTHLARQYVFQHRADYPGGVYWVRAKSRGELEYWFWRIARNEALRGCLNNMELRGGVMGGQKEEEELRDPRRIVGVVRRWLSAQAGWLMVLDGVQFDTPGLSEFIPDARDTSLIFTSTERAVTGDWRFDNPQVMELGLLTAQQGRDLLLLEMERKKPWSEEDQAMALELVGLMGRLPLMIHVAAQHLKATREPLAKYLKSYRSRPKAGRLPAYMAVREQLESRGQNAALNLISLLVFFDQHVPVEMVALGLSALDRVTPVKTRDALHGKASLNNTLKVLIAFALVQRSESDEISPTSSRSSKRSFDRHADYLDLLRVHSVVQAFFIDSLHEQHRVPFWLERATAVWCRSYDEADKRIQEDPRVGLPDDYRRFCIHGEKLRQHLGRFEKRYPGLGTVKSMLDERLEKIQAQIDHLSHAIQKNILDGSPEEHPASVFDRVSNSSQSDSATMESHSSEVSAGSFDGDGALVQSPSLLEPSPQTEIPYPSTPVMPRVPEIIEDDEETVIGTQVHAGGTEIDVVSLPPDPLDEHEEAAAFSDWYDVIPHHRVIRRQETRRYHDRAGAWRDRTISDPRVGLSREIALGSISSKREALGPSPLGARLTAQSEAEMELSKIKMASPPLPKPRGSFSSQAPVRPDMLIGRNSWARPQAQKTPSTEVAEIPPEQFSSGLAQVLSSPKSWTQATINLLKKTVLPSETPTGTPSQPQLRSEEELVIPPGPIFRGSRSANSSPASHTSPFPPPSFAGIPTEDLLPRTGLPIVVRRWDTVVYPPAGTPVTSSGIEWSSTPPDPLSLSYPTLLPSRQQHPDLLPIRSGPAAGYTSQPMSRDGSHRSNPSISIHSPSAAFPRRSRSPSPSASFTGHHEPASRPEPTTTATTTTSQPIPTPTTITTRPTGLIAAPFNHYNYHRRGAGGGRPPSYTETEPSPRTTDTTKTPPFADVDTSYRRWEQLHPTNYHGRRQRQQQQQGTMSFPVHYPPHHHHHASQSGGWLGRAGGVKGAGRGRSVSGGGGGGMQRRSQSVSPAGSFRRDDDGGSGSRSGSDSAASGSGSASMYHLNLNLNQQQQQHPLAEWSAPEDNGEEGFLFSGSAPTGSAGGVVATGGEPMARSASAGSGGGGGAAGGIRMGDGTVVEFGSPRLGSGDDFGPGFVVSGSGLGHVRRGDGGGKARRGSFPGMGSSGFL